MGDTIGLGANQMRLERVEPSDSRLAIRGWELGLDVVLEEQAAPHGDQREPVSSSDARRSSRHAPMEPGSLVMERKMLLGIRARAERLVTADIGR